MLFVVCSVWEVCLYVAAFCFLVSLIGCWVDMCSEGGGRLPVGRPKYAMTVRSLGSFSSWSGVLS